MLVYKIILLFLISADWMVTVKQALCADAVIVFLAISMCLSTSPSLPQKPWIHYTPGNGLTLSVTALFHKAREDIVHGYQVTWYGCPLTKVWEEISAAEQAWSQQMPDMFIEAPSPVLLQHSCLCACVSHPALENSAVLFFPSSL